MKLPYCVLLAKLRFPISLDLSFFFLRVRNCVSWLTLVVSIYGMAMALSLKLLRERAETQTQPHLVILTTHIPVSSKKSKKQTKEETMPHQPPPIHTGAQLIAHSLKSPDVRIIFGKHVRVLGRPTRGLSRVGGPGVLHAMAGVSCLLSLLLLYDGRWRAN